MTRVVVDRDSINDDFVVVKKLYRQSGELVEAADPILEIESSKTVKEIGSPEAGILKVMLCEGDEVAVGDLLFEVAGETETQAASATMDRTISVSEGISESVDTGPQERTLSRAAVELVQKLGVNPSTLPAGWITVNDVLVARGRQNPQMRSLFQKAMQHKDAPSQRTQATPKVPFRQERISPRKRTEARNLSRANGNGSTSVIGIELLLPGPRLVVPPFIFHESIADLVVFEGARLIRRFPELNAFHIDERTIGYFEEVNVGVSFDSGRNLKVLALAKADTLSLSMVQSGIENLLHLYESGGPIEESMLTTSTLTVSDLSRAQAHFMLPLLNADQSLIIGITRRSPIQYSLYAGFDHRISEGLQVAKMLGGLRERIVSHYRPAPLRAELVSSLRCSVCDQSLQKEVARGGRGLIQVVLADGSDGRLCWNCFSGW
jgi:pyruvate/2-oxoglutarate dehydrogenase complex dihydrolipoamide acyltransferase (E2) component